eukprot:CAMPEP_0119132804 /NCGR_PEP_ID=MMETSP1310-20130426/12333_1 /TAXON_ID=464262 /ORGANISM="Genus nov. species nov., Strain RCC2339" /LENGTH=427 /DNA_ID=CAMNT_0007123461 /DNA_START=362 /DNA_END=1645 /DNA_ORIENTATION=+
MSLDKKTAFVLNVGTRKVDTKKVNINGSDDPFYRYKVPQMHVQSVGKGKMIKTMLLNNDEVARGLHVEPEYIPAFMAYEIGSQFKYEKNKPERERASISGEYPSGILSATVGKLIKDVVICGQCGLPELQMAVKQKLKQIWINCASCGNRYQMVKGNPKFIRYIVNHPPPVKNLRGKKKEDDPKERKSSDKERKSADKERAGGDKAKEAPAADGGDGGGESNVGIEITEEDLVRTDAELKRLAKSGVEFESDMSAEALEKRRAELVPESVKQLVGANEEDAEGAAGAELRALVGQGASDEELGKAFVAAVEAKSATPREAMEILFPHIWEGTLKQILGAHKALLGVVLKRNAAQRAFLACLEAHLGAGGAASVKKTAPILKNLYDRDLLEEDNIIAWHKSSPAAHPEVRKAAGPLVTWLEEAEEESD